MNNFLNVCIVDDDAIYQFTTKKTIKSFNIAGNILALYDGEQAINFMIDNLHNAEKLPDIILLDINMPIMDGYQFMEEYMKIKPKLSKKITIYMVSSSVDLADIERAKKISDISDYIIKPMTREKIKSIIENLLK